MRTIFSLLVALICLATISPVSSLSAQSRSSKSSTARPSIDAVYKIRLGAYAKMDATQLAAAETRLKNLGQVTATSEGALTRLELGNYLGKATANKIVAEAKKRGYKDAYALKYAEFSNAMGEPLTHTFQFSAVKALQVGKLVDALKTAALPDNSLFIHQSNGFYHLSIGLFNLGMSSHEAAYDAFATEQGFKDGFAKTVSKGRGSTPIRTEPKEEKPKEEPKPEPAKEEPKPAPKPDDKKDKMNGNKDANGNSTADKDKKDKMSGNKDANTQDKKDKMNRPAADTSKTNPAPTPADNKKDKMKGKNVVAPVDSNKTVVKP